MALLHLSLCAQTPADIPPGLIAWWRGENSTADVLGNVPGTLMDGATYAAGRVGQGFLFNGTTSAVALGDTAALNFAPDSSFSIEAWFNSTGPNDAGNDAQAIVSLNNNCGNTYVALVFGNVASTIGFGVRDANGLGGNAVTPGAVSRNQYHHAVGVREVIGATKTLRLYLDGVLVSTVNDPSTGSLVLTAPDWIGRRNPCATWNVFKGVIDEIAIYGRALSATEVTAIFTAGTAGKSTVKPYFTNADPLPNGAKGTPYSFQFATAVAPGPHTFTFTGGTMPPGLELSASGLLYGTPTAAVAAVGLNVTATAPSGQSTTRTFAVNILPCLDPAPAGMIAWWRGQDDALDATGTNHGTLRGNAAYAAGKVGQGFTFDGSGDYVETPSVPALNFGTGDFTVEFWAKFNSIGGEQVLAEMFTGASGPGWTFTKLSSQRLQLYINGSPVNSPVNSFSTGVWYHFAARRASGVGSIFKDGVLIQSDPSANSANSTSSFKIASRNGTSLFLNGQMDEVALFNRALTDAEILAIYNAGSSGKCGAMVITTLSPLPGAGQSTAYSQPLSATGGTAPYNFTLLNGTPPSGLSLSSGGLLSGTPTAPGLSEFTVRVTDAQTRPAERHYTLKVNARPVLGVITNQQLNELAPLNVPNPATDADPLDTLSYSLVSPPAGAAISAAGTITWTPTEAQGPGVFTITTQVTDNGSPPLTQTNNFQVTVGEVNLPPTLPVQTNKTVNELALLTVPNAGSDTDLPANGLTYTLLSPPAGAIINPATGVITWTPTEAQGPGPGAYTFTTRVDDNGSPNLFTTNTFTVTVNEVNVAPTLPAQTNKTVNELALLTVNNTGSDTDLPANNLTYSLTTAPPGAAISAAGVITWMPTEAQGPGPGAYTFTTRVDDNGSPNLFTTNTFTVTVNEVNVAPVLPPPLDRNAAADSLLTVTDTATDSDLPANTLTYSLTVKPAGASISSTGVITWTPTQAQAGITHPFTVVVSDNVVPPLTATHSFNVTVSNNNLPPVLQAKPNITVPESTLMSVANPATDPNEPASGLHYTLLTPPPGASISAAGTITWTPTEAQGPGVFTITTQATDNGTPALSTTNSFQVTVSEVNIAPTLTPKSNVTINELTLLTMNNPGADTDLPANSLTYTLLTPPAGASISATGAITWMPTEAQGPGVFTITTQVTDNGTPPLSATNSFQVTVSEVNTAPVLGALSNVTVNPGQAINFTATSTDADLPANSRTYSLLSPPSGATINPTTGAFSWPTPANATVQVRVTDNGSPVLFDTKSFTVTVSAPSSDVELRNVSTAGGVFSFQVHGPSGANYTIEYSTDLVNWVGLVRQLAAVTPFTVTDPVISSNKRRYYRATMIP